jgi:release factor H-coupled RctB family protein
MPSPTAPAAPAPAAARRPGPPARATVQLVASAQAWVEGEAVRQLEQVAALPGMRRVAGLPDLHPGKGGPVGAAFASAGLLYPHLVGGDIGCGMALWRTDGLARRARRDRWAERLDLEGGADGEVAAARLAEAGLEAGPHDGALGTVGGGNHFAELQEVREVLAPGEAAALGLARGALALLVHSGSRGLGEAVLRRHVARFGAGALAEGSAEADAYLARHAHAEAWARVNRALIAARFLAQVGLLGERVLDVCHNGVSRAEVDGAGAWLHRKGAAPADAGPVVVPGSRGAESYLVLPFPEAAARASLSSLAHGAGRKWTRSAARERVRARGPVEALTRTALGSRVVCEDRDLLLEEAPEAYKRVDRVVADLVEAGLCRVVAVLSPVLTYKTRRRTAGD